MKARTFITAAAASAIVVTGIAAEVEVAAAAGSIGYVNTDSLHIRSGPSTGHSIVGSLTRGTMVTITGQSGSWYQIQYNNQQAYVHSSYVSATPTVNLTSTAVTYTVNASALNVRTEPNTTSSIITVLPNGEAISVQAEQNGWYAISINGKTGYVKKDYISTSTATSITYVVNASTLNVRSEPTTASAIIASLPNGQAVSVQTEHNGWYAISINGKTGYVKKDYVSISTNNSTTVSMSSVQSVTPTYYYVTCSSLRVRSGPSTSSEIVGTMQNGQQVQVIGTTNGWYKVRFSGKEGFVSAQYVQPAASSSSAQTAAAFQKPAAGTITSTFGMRWGSMHYGIDIAAAGTVKVNAAAAGTVTKSYYSASYGNVVFVTHKISGQTYTTVYAHLKSREVAVGATVAKGQLVGYMGNTGQSYGQHLHFELHKGEWNVQKTNAIDPLTMLQSS